MVRSDIMAVDFTPSRGDYTSLKPFRFWCQKVLPLVYDDSLSYYELLCKVVDYLNMAMEDVEVLNEDIDNMYTAFGQLQDTFNTLQQYVDDYFTNLDVQEEINNKLDEMASDGALVTILTPVITSVSTQVVTDWLRDNITPTTPVVDATLTISGAAADAKATGDQLANLKENLGGSIFALNETINTTEPLASFANPSGYTLNPETGLSVRSTNHELLKYRVNEGEYLQIVSPEYMQFQNDQNVPSTGTGFRIGETYDKFSGIVKVPEGATYLIFSNIIGDNIISVIKINKSIDLFDDIFSGISIENSMFQKGSIEGGNNNTYRQASRCRLINKAQYPVDVVVTVIGSTIQVGLFFYNESGEYINYATISSGSYTIPANSIFRMFIDGKRGLDSTEMTVDEILEGVEFSKISMGIVEISNNVTGLTEDVDNLIRSITSGEIPEYYFTDDYLQNKARSAQLNSNVCGVSFGFITDVHTGDSSRNSMKLAKYIADRTSAIPFMICGGDIPETNTGTLEGLYAQAQYWQEMMSQYGKHNVYSCRGNHDFLANLSSGSVSLTNGACYSYVMGYRPYNIVPCDKNKLAYYFDIPSAKIRFIVLDVYDVSNNDPNSNFSSYVGLSPKQYHWFAEEALNASDYDIVVVTHQPLNLVDDPSYITNLNLLRDIITAFNAHTAFSGSWGATTINVDFSAYTSNLICVLSGHKHVDASGDTGFLNIVTTSDAIYDTDGYNRTLGTISEVAFDIISIDTTNKIIKCTRIGAGNDRTFNY